MIEAASGTGEHGVYFASALPELTWQPSDVDPSNLASIDAWAQVAKLPNLLPPLTLNLGTMPAAAESGERYAAGFCANLIHIAPWHVCTHLLAFMAAHLADDAPFIIYGPYKVNGAHTSESNAKFEEWLHAQSLDYGVRDMEVVLTEASRFGLHHVQTITMPANNFCLVFRKASAS